MGPESGAEGQEEPGERDRPAPCEQGEDASKEHKDKRIKVAEHNVVILDEGAPPDGRHCQDQDIDHR